MIDDADFIQRVSWMLNLFEQDSGKKETEYDVVYRYHDGNNGRRQVTLGRGFTEDGGNLRTVLNRYFQNGGRSEVLRDRLPKVAKGVLSSDNEFVKALVAAGKEQAMKDAQDYVFLSAYLTPALQWADMKQFNKPLSYAITCDSFLHSGQMTKWLINSFPEHSPAGGGREEVWMRSYCEARLAWFQRAKGALHTCQFRPKFFLAQMDAGNWSFRCPMGIQGKGTIC